MYDPYVLFAIIGTPFLVTFVTCLLAVIFITDYKYHLLPSISLAFHHLFAELVGTQETSCILIAGLLERYIFDLYLPEFDKPWVTHLRKNCCCPTNLCTWRPNTVYKNRSAQQTSRFAHILWSILSFCFSYQLLCSAYIFLRDVSCCYQTLLCFTYIFLESCF